MKRTPSTESESRRLVHFTPLRYPGGKAKLASFVKSILDENNLVGGAYVEPYAGGAGIALELLFHEYATKIHINDISRPVFSFWTSVLNDTERMAKLVRDTPLNMTAWDRQKTIFSNPKSADDLQLGFATFFLNRTNRSGILNGGVIGGRDQTGPWKIDARYNAPELIFRIESIAKMRSRIVLTNLDAVDFLKVSVPKLPSQTLIYLDPPYYFKGKDLYYDYYSHADHAKVAAAVINRIRRQKWIVSYDNAPSIRRLYDSLPQMTYELGYSARAVRTGSEVMFFSPGLIVPAATGAIKSIRRRFCHSGAIRV